MANSKRRPLAALVPLGFGLITVGVLLWLSSGPLPEEPEQIAYFVSIIAWNISPHVLLALVLALVRRRRWLWRTALVYSILAGLFGLVVMATIILGDSSTSALAVVTLPAWLFAGMIPAAVVGWAIHRGRGDAR